MGLTEMLQVALVFEESFLFFLSFSLFNVTSATCRRLLGYSSYNYYSDSAHGWNRASGKRERGNEAVKCRRFNVKHTHVGSIEAPRSEQQENMQTESPQVTRNNIDGKQTGLLYI